MKKSFVNAATGEKCEKKFYKIVTWLSMHNDEIPIGFSPRFRAGPIKYLSL